MTAATLQRCKETKARVRNAMDMGISLNFMVRKCGLSKYRISTVMSDIADGRIAGGDFNVSEVIKLNNYLDDAASRLAKIGSESLLAAISQAMDVGFKGSSIARGACVTMNRFNHYRTIVANGKDDHVMFSAEERDRFFTYISSLVKQL